MKNLASLKRFFVFCLIGSLVASAAVAVIAVLMGSFNDIAGKAVFTLMMVVAHSLVSLLFIWENDKLGTFDRLAFFINTLFIIIIASFVTSIGGIWQLIDGDLVSRLYFTYLTVGFACLHIDVLSKALNVKTFLNNIIFFNYVMIAIVAVMLQFVIHLANPEVLGEFYFRLLGAVSIVDGTLSVLAIIFYRLFAPKQNIATDGQGGAVKNGWSVWIWLLVAYIAVQIVVPFIFWGVSLMDVSF